MEFTRDGKAGREKCMESERKRDQRGEGEEITVHYEYTTIQLAYYFLYRRILLTRSGHGSSLTIHCSSLLPLLQTSLWISNDVFQGW